MFRSGSAGKASLVSYMPLKNTGAPLDNRLEHIDLVRSPRASPPVFADRSSGWGLLALAHDSSH